MFKIQALKVALRNPKFAIGILLARISNRFRSTDYVGIVGNRSVSDNSSYIVAVKEALNKKRIYESFKRDSRYNGVLEHTSKAQGVQYLDIIRRENPFLLERPDDFKKNDLIGLPRCHFFPGIGMVSPSTLRYLKVVSDITSLFGRDLGDKVIEIGVGYGGQMLLIDTYLSLRKYYLVDLPPVLDLSKKYLESFNLKSAYSLKTLNQLTEDKSYDLVISNYAFSELPAALQLTYIRKILSKSKRGYLTMNSGIENSAFMKDKLSLAELKGLLPPFEVRTEVPTTHPANYILTWGS